MNKVERLWADILSRDADRVRATWDTLNTEEKLAVHKHLLRMTTEDGWTEPQQISAQAALEALRDRPNSGTSDATPDNM